MCALHPIFFGFIALLINWRYLCMYDLYPLFSFPIFLTTQSILPSNLPICLINVPRSSSIIICTISTISWLWQQLRRLNLLAQQGYDDPSVGHCVSPLIKISEPIKFGLSDLNKKRNFKDSFPFWLKIDLNFVYEYRSHPVYVCLVLLYRFEFFICFLLE